MLKLRRPRESWQVWIQASDGRWSTIGAPRETFIDAAHVAKILSLGKRTVAVVPVTSRPIQSV